MPEEFDPRWEYWTPSSDILELQEEDRELVTSDERIGLFEEDNRSRSVLVGYRITTARHLRLLQFRYGKEKKVIGSERTLEQRPCSNRKCGRLFYPSQSSTKYCSMDCVERKGAPKRIPSIRQCPICPQRRKFVPTRSSHKYCSIQCANRSFKVIQVSCMMCGEPVPINKCRNHNRGKYCSMKCKKKRDNKVQRDRKKEQMMNYIKPLTS